MHADDLLILVHFRAATGKSSTVWHFTTRGITNLLCIGSAYAELCIRYTLQRSKLVIDTGLQEKDHAFYFSDKLCDAGSAGTIVGRIQRPTHTHGHVITTFLTRYYAHRLSGYNAFMLL